MKITIGLSIVAFIAGFLTQPLLTNKTNQMAFSLESDAIVFIDPETHQTIIAEIDNDLRRKFSNHPFLRDRARLQLRSFYFTWLGMYTAPLEALDGQELILLKAQVEIIEFLSKQAGDHDDQPSQRSPPQPAPDDSRS